MPAEPLDFAAATRIAGRSSPLQNRVDPYGILHAAAPRGELMGNRGGRFHNDAFGLGAARWRSKQWIACACTFRGRHRDVWGKSYTELFFLDEPTALAAGHRPCFECRRAEALHFQSCFAAGKPMAAADIDRRLHAERLVGRDKRLHRCDIESLPDGTMIAMRGKPFLVRGRQLLPWSFAGYGEPAEREGGAVDVLTPPSIVAALARFYRPRFHASAEKR